MDITRFTPAADHHTNTIHADGSNVARTAAALHAIAHTGVVMIAANYAFSAHRSGVNHV